MSDPRPRAPRGDLATYEKFAFVHDGMTHDVYRKGTGPVVIVITEMPGMSPYVLGFGDRVAAHGLHRGAPEPLRCCRPGPVRRLQAGAGGIRHEHVRSGVHQPGVHRPRDRAVRRRCSGGCGRLPHQEHERAGGPGCRRRGHVLHRRLRARDGRRRPRAGTGALATVAAVRALQVPEAVDRLQRRGPRNRPGALRRRRAPGARACASTATRSFLPSGSRSCENGSATASSASSWTRRTATPTACRSKHHSVLTGDLIDDPGEPTRDALDQVLDLFRTKLLAV